MIDIQCHQIKQRWTEIVIPNFYLNHTWTAYMLDVTALKRASLGINLPDSYHMEGTHLKRYKRSLSEGKTGSLLHPYLETKVQLQASSRSSIKFAKTRTAVIIGIIVEGHQGPKLGIELCRWHSFLGGIPADSSVFSQCTGHVTQTWFTMTRLKSAGPQMSQSSFT